MTTDKPLTPKVKRKILWDYNQARAFNKGIEKAANIASSYISESDRDLASEVFCAIHDALIPFWPPEIQAKFERRYTLIDKKCGWKSKGLTQEEEKEYQALSEELHALPHAYDPEGQKALDHIRETAAMLHRHGV